MCVTNCLYCHSPLSQRPRGRPRHFCGAACRQKAYRRRRAVTVAVMRRCGMGAYVPMKWADFRKVHLWESMTQAEKTIRVYGLTGGAGDKVTPLAKMRH